MDPMNSGVLADLDSVVNEPVLEKRNKFPQTRLVLASGYYFKDDLLSFMYVGKSVRTTWRLVRARFHPFTKSGYRAALLAATDLRKQMCPAACRFLMRVLVTGDMDDPVEIIEAWRLEGSKPGHVKYYFH